MKLTIQLFAGLAEQVGNSQLSIEIGDHPISLIQLKAMIVNEYSHAAPTIAISFFAVNQAYALDDDIVRETDEIALIPPVSGGQEPAALTSEDSNYILTSEPLFPEDVTAKVLHPHHGASLVFIGTTRELTEGKRTILLEYEAYGPMALRTMEQIGVEISDKWNGTIVAISHRIGRVNVGEISVVIAVSSPHRAACYEASRYAIERLKQVVPIWKKELWEDGSEWKGHQTGPWNPTSQID